MIIEQAFDAVDLVLDGVAASPFGRQNAWAFSRYDMVFHFQRASDGLVLDLNYNTDLYDGARIQRSASACDSSRGARHLRRIPRWAICRCSRLRARRHRRIRARPRLRAAGPGDHQAACFSAAAARFADRPALIEPDGEITYRALAAITDDLALHLAGAFDIVPGDRVAVLAERSIASVTAMLAIIKAGAVYVPIDPALPIARMVAMAGRADCRLVLRTLACASPHRNSACGRHRSTR